MVSRKSHPRGAGLPVSGPVVSIPIRNTFSMLPDKLTSVEQLDDILSTPSDALIEDVRKLDGDFMILGANGKIGPTMARMLKRAVDASGSGAKVYAVDVM